MRLACSATPETLARRPAWELLTALRAMPAAERGPVLADILDGLQWLAGEPYREPVEVQS